jgi:hypothetical protein
LKIVDPMIRVAIARVRFDARLDRLGTCSGSFTARRRVDARLTRGAIARFDANRDRSTAMIRGREREPSRSDTRV